MAFAQAVLKLLEVGIQRVSLMERARAANVNLRGDEQLVDLGGAHFALRPEVAAWLRASGLAEELTRGHLVAALLEQEHQYQQSPQRQQQRTERRRQWQRSR